MTGAILIGLGFTPLLASGLSLIANTAPVAFGALGTPIIALQSVTGLDLRDLSAMVGRQLPFFSVIVPFWLVWAFAGLRGTIGVWPAALVAGVSFAVPQFLVSNFHGPWLVDVVVGRRLHGRAHGVFLRFWRPRERWGLAAPEAAARGRRATPRTPPREVRRAWMPWLILSVLVFVWGLPQVQALRLDGISVVRIPCPACTTSCCGRRPWWPRPAPEAAVYNLNWLSATGSAILLAALIAGLAMGFRPRELAQRLLGARSSSCASRSSPSPPCSPSGFTTRYSGVDATLGLAFARTGVLYPFFGTLLGWLGVALTGSDTSSNVLFGSLQRITAEQLGLSPTLMAAANSSGGVMGKMVDAQSIVVASTATHWYGHEGDILRYVFLHSLALACLVGLLGDAAGLRVAVHADGGALKSPSVPSRRLPRVLMAVLLLAELSAGPLRAADGPAAPLEQELAAAEKDLRVGELQSAESHYREALLEAWMLMGGLLAGDGKLAEAREAFRRAARSAVETRRPLQSLALVHLQTGEAAEAVAILTRLATRAPKDVQTRRLLAQALVASGQPAEAVQELEEARALNPGDLEMTFTLASGYLRVGKADEAARLFAEVVRGRPIPQTRVLIGRTYRDFGMYDQARSELKAALKQDPKVRRAHYYLGMIGVVEEGTSKLEEAITEFGEELKLAPGDPVTNLRLGMALVEAQRNADALPHLELAARSEPPSPDAYHYLGRCQLGLDRAADAVPSLRTALTLSQGPVVDEVRLGGIHYLLGLALRKQGAAEEAAVHFAEAEKNSARRTTGSREYLARYLADLPNTEGVVAALPSLMEASPLAGLSPAARTELQARAKAALARVYLNLGVMHAQAERFSRAADEFERAAEVDPDFPQVQYSLGVAQFNARRFDRATAPLARVLAAHPDDAGVRRMLAMAWLNTDAYDKAAELLATDPERGSDPSLEYAYGLALVRSGRAREAEVVFSRLLARHGGTPELNVVLAQAHAQQDDYQSAIDLLQKAIAQKADVAEAQATLGFIYLRQGKLPEAEEALRAELRGHPDDLRARHHLATVLDLAGRPEEALPLLRAVLKVRPDFSDARYLLGKILLAQGQAVEAAEHLEAALRTAPEDANIHYQLAQAYQKLGREDQARERFESFQKLKDKRRGSLP